MWISAIAILISSYEVQESTQRPELQLSCNQSSGNISIALSGEMLVGGLPTFGGAAPDPPLAGNSYVWMRKVLNRTYCDRRKTVVTSYNWGSWSLTHTDPVPMGDGEGSLAINLTFSVTNTLNRSLANVNLQPFGIGDRADGTLGVWNFGGCDGGPGSNGCSQIKPSSSQSPCHADWRNPQGGGSPYCRTTDSHDGIGLAPQILVADFPLGAVVTTLPLYQDGITFGFPWVAGGFRLNVVINEIAVSQTKSTTLAMRFASPESESDSTPDRGRKLLGLANDTLSAYRKRFPNTVRWPDRRPIGALFPSDCGASCHCKSLSPQDCPNPRGYNFVKSGGEDGVNVTSKAGIAQFKSDLLAYVNRSISYCKDYMGNGGSGPAACQGIMIWSLEGQQYPQTISWVGDPRLLHTLSPEMDNAADDMFKMITDAGMQCGMTLRPQQWTQNPHWNSSLAPNQRPFKYYQRNLLLADNTSDINGTADLIISKASYAYKRWGCKMFYVDTTVCDPCPTHTLPAEVWFKVHTALPECVFFPEESTFAYRSVVAPLQDNWGGYAISTPYSADLLYGRDAWSFGLMQFQPGGTPPGSSPITQNMTLLREYASLVGRGDSMLVDAWYNNSVNTFVKLAYEMAANKTKGENWVQNEAKRLGCSTSVVVNDDPIVNISELARTLDLDMGNICEIVWAGRPIVENFVTAQRCVNAESCKLTFLVPWNLLHRTRQTAILPRGWSSRIAMCSDGLDNDGDGLVDAIDPSCNGSMANDSESTSSTNPSNLKLDFGVDSSGGAYIKSLTWNDISVVKDDGTQGNRYFLHGDLGAKGTQFTSDLELYDVGIEPWLPNISTWKTANSPIANASYGSGHVRGRIISNDTDSVTMLTTSPFLSIVDRIQAHGDNLVVTTNITSLYGRPMAAYVPLVLGNLQLGRTNIGCICNESLTVFSGTSPADGHGEAGNCTATCRTGLFHLDRLRHGSIQQGQPWDNISPGMPIPPPSELSGWRTMPARGNSYPSSSYSPVTALGGAGANEFTVGMQVLSSEITPDKLHDTTVEFYDVPAAPKHPLLTEYLYTTLPKNGTTRTFTTIIRIGKPGKSWDNPSAAIENVLSPYKDFFSTMYGGKPVYCPSGAIVMRFSESKNFNRTTNTYDPGASFWNDDLMGDSVMSGMIQGGFDKVFVWDGQIDGRLLSPAFGGANFNPNSAQLDPNLDAACNDEVFKNATSAFRKKGLSVNWYGRPRMMIMSNQDPSRAAGLECPAKRISQGHGVMCNLTNFSDPCTKAQFENIDRLVALGVTGFYWDEYQAVDGRMTFTQAVLKKYPNLQLLGEQGVDIDSLQVYGLPWMGMPAGVWDPPFEPNSMVLQKLLSPLSTTIVGTYGADNNVNHTTYSLTASQGTSLMMLSGTLNTSAHCPGKESWCPHIWQHQKHCEQMRISASNAAWRFEQYGKAMNCKPPLPFDATALQCN